MHVGEMLVKRSFRLTKEQEEKLMRECRALGISPSAYIRKLLEKQPEIPSMGREEREYYIRLTSEINRIGVNINQIVKNVNSFFYSREEKKELYELLKKVYELLDERRSH